MGTVKVVPYGFNLREIYKEEENKDLRE